jgi:hypothetical protein
VDTSKYWDLVEIAERNSNLYTDWEGFADPSKVHEIINSLSVNEALDVYADHEPRVDPEFVRDMLAHAVYEQLDQGGAEVTMEEAVEFVHLVMWIFGCRYWMKRSAE